MAQENSSDYDTTPQAALAALETHDGPLLLDLDETLYLRNSTEDFIDAAWPAPIAFALLLLLDKLRPWRWSGGGATRDVWRVSLLRLALPWTLWRWRRRARRLGADFRNTRLIAALDAHSARVTVVTLGFTPIVIPLLRAMGLGDWALVSMGHWGVADRRRGKLAFTAGRLGRDAIRRSLVLTDSTDDADILAACAMPMRVLWPEASFRDAFSTTYLPGQYLSRVKRPGMQYIYRGIILEDFAFWVLASIFIAWNPVMHLIGLGLIAISFWAIYECGYVDNDLVGARFEADPNLSSAFHAYPVEAAKAGPWLWAAACGWLGLAALRWPQWPGPADLLTWTALLLVTYYGFRIYNRYDKASRIWMFGGLQLLRIAAFVVLVPVEAFGMMALCAHAFARWVPYSTYRLTGAQWSDGYLLTIRLFFFTILAVMLASALGWHHLTEPTALALFGWNVFKARHELKTIFARAHRIDRGVAQRVESD